MRFLFSFFLFHGLLAIHCEASLDILLFIDHLHNQRERDLPFDLTRVSSSVRGETETNPIPNFKKPSPPPFPFLFPPPPTTSHLIQPQNHTLIIPRLPIQIQPRRHITFPPIRPIIRTIPIPRFRLQPLQFQRRRCRFNHGELLKCEDNRGGFVRREELDCGPVVGRRR